MIKYVDNGSIYEISENDVEMILLTAAESAEIDLKTCSQRQWKWCLQQAGKYLNRNKRSFKSFNSGSGPVYRLKDIIDIYNMYIELNNKYNKFISIEGFSYFSGVGIDVIQSWQNIERADTSCIAPEDNRTEDYAEDNRRCNTDISEDNIDTIEHSIDNISIIDNIDDSSIYRIDNNNINNNRINNNKDSINYIRYNNKANCQPFGYNMVDNANERRAALHAIYSGLQSGKRECILDKAYDSNTGLSSPFLYNTEFGSYSGNSEHSALPVSGGDRQAIAARYGFQAIEQHDD